MVHDVDLGIACTWHWLSAKYHELVVGCVGFAQQIWMLDQPQSEYGKTPIVQLQWVELSQWRPMVGTPSTPGKGCGQ